MDFKQIQELIKLINKSNIGEVTIEENGQKLTIKQKKDPAPIIAGMQSVSPAMSIPMATAPAASNTAVAPAASKEAVPTSASANTITIKSPMIGTFYRKSSPDKPNLAEVGSEVSPGKVVCIIEAMKLFNEIESEVKGRIVKVLVEDASPVEFDQPLFLVEPN
jgi:acetyl-CoA carboxylase biotin carboxyl carrier protein